MLDIAGLRGNELFGNPATYLSMLKKLEPATTSAHAWGVQKWPTRSQFCVAVCERRITRFQTRKISIVRFLLPVRHNTISIVSPAMSRCATSISTGETLPVDRVKCEGHSDWADHIILERLRITGHGNNQQTVGISTKCPAWGWVIRNNSIAGAGTGLYLGNSDGRAPFIAGVIEHNLVVDSRGYNL